MKQEKRRFPRVPIYLEVGAKHNGRPLIRARSFDISGGGIRLFLAERLLKDDVVKMELDLSVPPIIARGEVVWIQEVETMGNKFFQTGIRFTNMKPADKTKMETLAHLYT